MLKFSKRYFSGFVSDILSKPTSNSVKACIVSNKELKAQKFDFLGELSSSQDFQKDLNLSTSYWFYHPSTKERCLLLQYKPKDASKESDQLKSIRQLGFSAVQELQSKKADDATIIVSDDIPNELVGPLQNVLITANYEKFMKGNVPEEDKKKEEEDFDERTLKKTKQISNIVIKKEDSSFESRRDFQFWKTAAHSTNSARDVLLTRGSTCTPEYFSGKIAEAIRESNHKLKVEEVKGKELQEKGMNLFYNVGKGSSREPRMVVVEYKGNPDVQENEIALVGKGLTFDTGGLHLKPTGSINEMYMDKAGACAVYGALRGALELGVKKNVVFAFGLAENAIDNTSYMPMDIITSLKGLTVEIGNTDAEGRLVLADTMTYVQRNFKPQKMIELSTLTGAMLVALGEETAGIFGNDPAFLDEIRSSGTYTNENFWIMPITEENKLDVKGQDADLSNSPKARFGGSGQAAAFLERFVEKNVKWAHLDIAGPAMVRKSKLPGGGCLYGFGTHTLLHYLMKEELAKS